MRHRMLSCTICAALSCFASSGFAQTPSLGTEQSERSRRLLNSQLWSDKAWGAHIAGQLRTDESKALLVEQLRIYAALREAASWTDERAFLNVLLDAAIQSGAVVPAQVLEPYRDKEAFVCPFLILAARTTNSDLVLPLASSPNDYVWLAANNLLYIWRSETWYQGLLAEIAPTHRFRVKDPDDTTGSGEGSGGGRCAHGILRTPEGFPPVAHYWFATEPASDFVVLASGPRNMYYRRWVVTTERQVATCSCLTSLKKMQVQIGYLARLSGRDEAAIERIFHASSDLTFQGGMTGFTSAVNAKLDVQAHELAEILEHIRTSYGLPVPNLPLTIAVEVIDQRSNRAEPLPAVAGRPVQLR